MNLRSLLHWPRTLFARLALILFVGLALAQTLSFWLTMTERDQTMTNVMMGYIEREVARVLRPFADAAGLIETGPFNLGRASDFRVPDGGYHRSVPEGNGLYVSTATLVVEVVATDDEAHEKLPFYAAHGVEEVIVVEPASRTVGIRKFGDGYEDVAVSGVLGLSADGLQSAIRWPAPEGLAV